MSLDKEKDVLEQTRRNHSGIHAVSGNLFKIDTKERKNKFSENDVSSPIKAIGILGGATLALVIAVYILYGITQLF